MEIEFNGISEGELRSICSNLGLKADILALKKRYLVCENDEVRDFGEGEISYYVYDDCCHGYFYCGGHECRGSPEYRSRTGGRSTRRRTGPRGRTSRSKTSTCDCNDYSGNDCGGTNDTLAAIIIFIAIVALVLFIMWLIPVLIPIFISLVNLGLAAMLGLFNIITFGALRKKFKRVLVYLPKDPDRETLERLISEVATFGGLPRRFSPPFKYGYYTNGFFLLRTGAYLFIPALIGTLLVLWIQPESNFILFAPILSFAFSIMSILLGNILINKKAREVSRVS
ncbi:MAG: hypothetical protein ACTSW1_14810 [Candidatus Hodarchaeales archaeon]